MNKRQITVYDADTEQDFLDENIKGLTVTGAWQEGDLFVIEFSGVWRAEIHGEFVVTWYKRRPS